jgi:amino acid permease
MLVRTVAVVVLVLYLLVVLVVLVPFPEQHVRELMREKEGNSPIEGDP